MDLVWTAIILGISATGIAAMAKSMQPAPIPVRARRRR